MSRRFILSGPASQDLDGILSYVLEHGGPGRAQHVADRLHEAFTRLANTPGLGHRREDLTPLPVRFFTVWSYLVIYRVETKPLQIIRVLHGARDVETLLGESE
jgi:toxin ParE1/3/4